MPGIGSRWIAIRLLCFEGTAVPGTRQCLARCPNRPAPVILQIVPTFNPPGFTKPILAAAPDARFVPAPADGVLPEGFFSTTNLPTYVRIGGEWRLPREPRMDSALVIDRDGVLWVREMRRVRGGDLIAVGKKEDGSEGIFVNAEAAGSHDNGEFKFMASEVSREKPT